MRVGLVTIAYNEERFIRPFLAHVPNWVDEVLLLRSTKPWNGDDGALDMTADIARAQGVAVIEYDWPTETAQRNAGQEYFHGYDWIITLDPDEFMADEDWLKLRRDLMQCPAGVQVAAFVTNFQHVYYKNKEVLPHTDYQQIIAVRPNVRFVDKRVVGVPYVESSADLHHFSWARTDEEILSKINHYAHANEFDGQKWFDEVWRSGATTNLHPLTPETLKALREPSLPPELRELDLWP